MQISSLFPRLAHDESVVSAPREKAATRDTQGTGD